MATPRLSPRPAYPPAWPIVRDAAWRTLNMAVVTTTVAVATSPLYRKTYATFASSVDVPELLNRYAPWVTRDDLWFTAGLSSSITSVYVLYNGVFFACDHWKLLQSCKMPRKPVQEPSAELVAATLRKELLTHLFTGPLIMLLLAGPLFRHTSGGATAVSPAHIPTPATMASQFTVAFLVNETLFYWGHRLLHTPALYATIHKQHHQYKGTRSFAAEYAHLVEDMLTAYLPYVAGLLMMRAHFHVVFVWFLCRLTETYEAHSGYCLAHTPLDRLGLSHWPQAVFHDHHHTINLGSFGWELLDFAFGTMDPWVAAGGAEGYLGEASSKGYRGKQPDRR